MSVIVPDAAQKLASALLLVVLLVCAAPAQSGVLTLNIDAPIRSGPGNTTYLFSGTVGNGSGVDLMASDLAFDFSGFDNTVLTPVQLLGNPDFSIPNNTTSATTALFDVTLNAFALPGHTYNVDVLLQDTANDLSDTVTLAIHVIPEPSAGALVICGLLLMAAVAWRRP